MKQTKPNSSRIDVRTLHVAWHVFNDRINKLELDHLDDIYTAVNMMIPKDKIWCSKNARDLIMKNYDKKMLYLDNIRKEMRKALEAAVPGFFD